MASIKPSSKSCAPAPSNLDYAVSPLESWIVNSNVDLNRQLGRRSSLRLFYGYGFQDMGDSGVQDDLLLTPDQPANDLYAHGTKSVEINHCAFRRADQLQRRKASCPLDVVHSIMAYVHHAKGVHPPLDVAPSIHPWHPDMLAHREHNAAPGSPDLTRKLDPRG